MKKTTKIHLVLVTALLASCRVIIPDEPEAGYIPDPSLTAAPLDSVDSSNFYFNAQPYAFRYAPASIYRRGVYWHNHVFIVRGGFGKAAASTAS